MESGRGEGAECLLIEVREREREGGGGEKEGGDMHICSVARRQAGCAVFSLLQQPG